MITAGISVATINRPAGEKAVVTVDGEVVAVLPLSTPVELSVDGPLGPSHISCDGTGIQIVDSPCPNKTCVHMGKANVTGQTILCVPNHVAIRIEGDNGNGVDGVTG